jgi:hypothetical protein
MHTSGWLKRAEKKRNERTQYAGERVLTQEAKQRNMKRAIADARHELIDCQNELALQVSR